MTILRNLIQNKNLKRDLTRKRKIENVVFKTTELKP